MVTIQNAWRSVVFAGLLGAVAVGPAWSQDTQGSAAPEEPPAGAQDSAATEEPPAQSPIVSRFRPVLGAGFTFGGDRLASVVFSDNTAREVAAGEVIQVYAGLQYRAVPTFSVQATLGYHFADVGAANGGVVFSRYPLELLGHFHLDERWAFGGGMRFVGNAKLAPRGDLQGPTIEYDNTTGVVVEGEYRFNPRMGLKLRFVSEEYVSPITGTFDGSHLGLLFSLYLF